MKKFIRKISLLALPFLLIFLGIGFFADGYTDPFYIRFTTPKQKSLIIGTSRAAQGLQPLVFKRILNKDIYNYAFTIGHSPFGPAYFKSIKRKFNKKKGGIFIITMDPWSISSRCNNPNDFTSFRENKLCVANQKLVNIKPNFEYLFENLRENYFSSILFPSKTVFLHGNGWYEVNANMDSVFVKKNIKSKIELYRTKNLPYYRYSKLRLQYLKKIILFLKEYGDVYLVRLPMHQKMMDIEDELMPDFTNKIEDLIPLTKGYLDLTIYNQQFMYTDGNHLYKTSGKEVSTIVARWIKGLSNNTEK